MKKENIQTRKRKPKNPGQAREGPPKKLSSSYSYLKQQQALEAERMLKEQEAAEQAAVAASVQHQEFKAEHSFRGKARQCYPGCHVCLFVLDTLKLESGEAIPLSQPPTYAAATDAISVTSQPGQQLHYSSTVQMLAASALNDPASAAAAASEQQQYTLVSASTAQPLVINPNVIAQ